MGLSVMIAAKRDVYRASDPELAIGVIPVEDGSQLKAVTPVTCGGCVTEAKFEGIVIFPGIAGVDDIMAAIAGSVDGIDNIRP